MSNDDDRHVEPTLDDNPGLEHDRAMPEGEPMTGTGSKAPDPGWPDARITLADNPGLEHEVTTEKGRPMTGSGAVPADGDEPDELAEPPDPSP
jgi:hypothetical protein